MQQMNGPNSLIEWRVEIHFSSRLAYEVGGLCSNSLPFQLTVESMVAFWLRLRCQNLSGMIYKTELKGLGRQCSFLQHTYENQDDTQKNQITVAWQWHTNLWSFLYFFKKKLGIEVLAECIMCDKYIHMCISGILKSSVFDNVDILEAYRPGRDCPTQSQLILNIQAAQQPVFLSCANQPIHNHNPYTSFIWLSHNKPVFPLKQPGLCTRIVVTTSTPEASQNYSGSTIVCGVSYPAIPFSRKPQETLLLMFSLLSAFWPALLLCNVSKCGTACLCSWEL